MPLTKTESDLLRYIALHVDEFGYQPTYQEIADAWGYSSKGYILTLVNSLRVKGVVKSTGPRAIGFDYKTFLQ